MVAQLVADFGDALERRHQVAGDGVVVAFLFPEADAERRFDLIDVRVSGDQVATWTARCQRSTNAGEPSSRTWIRSLTLTSPTMLSKVDATLVTGVATLDDDRMKNDGY